MNTRRSAGVPAAVHGERLAVVIPAYKGRHLPDTLAAFAAQTCRRFRVYVADDASPENLEALVAPFAGRLDLVYRRFPENLGRVSLARHWDRAIALGDERWVWLFSDDDLVSPDCVAAFWAAQEGDAPAAGLHRFQSEFIGADGRPLPGCRIMRYPVHQTWEEHVRALANRDALYVSIVQNIVFPRELYQRHGGFADYPLGLWSDYITWARWARADGIRTLPAGLVSYRVHAGSIGGNLLHAGADRSELLRVGGRMFADLSALFAAEGKRAPELLLLAWFARLFRFSPFPLSATERRAAAQALRTGWPRLPLVREAVFWWHAVRPILKRQPWLRRLARRGAVA